MLDIRTRIRTDLNPSKQIRFRIRSENIRTVFIMHWGQALVTQGPHQPPVLHRRPFLAFLTAAWVHARTYTCTLLFTSSSTSRHGGMDGPLDPAVNEINNGLNYKE